MVTSPFVACSIFMALSGEIPFPLRYLLSTDGEMSCSLDHGVGFIFFSSKYVFSLIMTWRIPQVIFKRQSKNALMQSIEERCAELGIEKQSQLADYCGVDRSPVNRFANGRGISADNINKILEKLGFLEAYKNNKKTIDIFTRYRKKYDFLTRLNDTIERMCGQGLKQSAVIEATIKLLESEKISSVEIEKKQTANG